MINFRYRAKKNDEIVTGNIKAIDANDAVKKLEYRGLIVIELSEQVDRDSLAVLNENMSIYKTMLSVKEKLDFFSNFEALYSSGIPIREIFDNISSSAINMNVRAVSYQIFQDVQKGRTLQEAMSPFSLALGKEYIALVCAGEKSGKLNEVLFDIVKNIKNEQEIKDKVISAITYPSCVFVFAIIIFMFFKIFILKVFEKMGDGITQEAVISLFIISLVKVAIILLVLAIIIFFVIKSKLIRAKLKNFILSLPVFSKLYEEFSFQNFFSILSLAYDSGIPTIEATALAVGGIKINSIRMKLHKSVKMLSSGSEITTAFMVAGVFSKFAISQISNGEKSGELGKTMKIVANDYEKKLEMQIGIITKLMEPFILIFIGIMVAYIIYSAYTKYYQGIIEMF